MFALARLFLGAIAFLALASCESGSSLLVERNVDLCNLHSPNDVTDGQHVRMHGTYGWSRHGASLMRFECPHKFVLVDTRPVENTPLERELMQASIRMQSEPPTQRIEIEASGALRHVTPLPPESTDMLQRGYV